MLEIDAVDLGLLCTALEDNSYEHQWWFDPRTGEVELHSEYGDSRAELGDPEPRGLIPVEPVGSHEAYRDLEDFTARVRDPRTRELLERAIAGRGAFRRFKDTLFDFPELREAWFAFHDARMQRRALAWLADEGVVDRDAAERAVGARPDPEPAELGGPFDPFEIARAVAADLSALYGERLRKVILFGSWARGDAHPESDIDLLVVLDRIESRWSERDAMDETMWRHSLANDTLIVEVPVDERTYEEADWPLLVNVRREGVSIA